MGGFKDTLIDAADAYMGEEIEDLDFGPVGDMTELSPEDLTSLQVQTALHDLCVLEDIIYSIKDRSVLYGDEITVDHLLRIADQVKQVKRSLT